MRHPDKITAYLRDRFDRDYPDWARGRGTWPMRIPLHPPTTGQRTPTPLPATPGPPTWGNYTGPGQIDTQLPGSPPEYTPCRRNSSVPAR